MQIGRMGPMIFWGCGGQATVLREAVEACGGSVAAVVSDGGEISFDGQQVLSFDSFVNGETYRVREGGARRFIVAIGGERGRERLERQARMMTYGLLPQTVIHPSATILGGAEIGEGGQILARAVVGVNARLGACTIVNTGAIIDHESTAGDGCHVAPGAVILGRASLGERVFVGANATVLPDISIVSDVVIGAGSVVTQSIIEAGTYVGSPARIRIERGARL